MLLLLLLLLLLRLCLQLAAATPSCLRRCVLFVAAPDLRGKLCCGVVAFRCAHGGKRLPR